jgi:LmbE family N-acetylglucosaminyl deacetylase
MAERALIIAPHPDDEVLGCGGTIAVLTSAGHEVHVAYLTSGEQGSAETAPDRLGGLREQEARAATSVLGVPSGNLAFLRTGDGRICPDDLDQACAVIGLLRGLRPTLLYLPHARDGSHDHEAAHRVVMRAAGMAGSGNFPGLGSAWWVPTILGYEVWAPIAAPAYLEDIGPHAGRKAAALACYSSQAGKGRGQASHVGPAGLALAAWRGAVTTGGHREAFDVLRLGRLIA